MKKLVLIMLILMYGFSTMGMTINLHYCCGKLESIDLTSSSANNGSHKMGLKACCETKQISNKEKADQENYLSTIKILRPFSETILPSAEVYTFKGITGNIVSATYSSLPSSPPVFILNCDLR